MRIESEKLENTAEDEKYLSANGKEVFVTAETMDHLKAHPDVVEFLEEAISKVRIPDGEDYFRGAINLEREIGMSLLVKADQVSPSEEADFALRTGREWPVRVKPDSKGEPCDSVTLYIRLDDKLKKYIVETAYIRHPCPNNPYYVEDKNSDEYEKSLDFWCSHALAYDPKIMGKPFKASWNSILTRAQLLS